MYKINAYMKWTYFIPKCKNNPKLLYLCHVTFFINFGCSQGYPCPPNYNPADFFIQTLAIQPGIEQECLLNVKKICDSFDVSETAEKIKTAVEEIPTQNNEFLEMKAEMKKRSPYKASYMEQFRALYWRSVISMMKEPMVIRVRVIQTLVRKAR